MTHVRDSGSQDIGTEQHVVLARQLVRKLAVQCGLRLVDQTKIVTAASELARNTVIYGGGGALDWAILDRDGRTGLRLVFRDQGPGIPNLDLAMTDGWTSGSGLGLGLTGSRRLVDEFELDSAPGAGTRVTVIKWT